MDMLFSNGRTRNFLRLLFPTRHGEKEEEKVLNENKGGNGMSEHGLRSGLDELRHRFMMQCVAAPLPE
jgi:hypothetical protein